MQFGYEMGREARRVDYTIDRHTRNSDHFLLLSFSLYFPTLYLSFSISVTVFFFLLLFFFFFTYSFFSFYSSLKGRENEMVGSPTILFSLSPFFVSLSTLSSFVVPSFSHNFLFFLPLSLYLPSSLSFYLFSFFLTFSHSYFSLLLLCFYLSLTPFPCFFLSFSFLFIPPLFLLFCLPSTLFSYSFSFTSLSILFSLFCNFTSLPHFPSLLSLSTYSFYHIFSFPFTLKFTISFSPTVFSYSFPSLSLFSFPNTFFFPFLLSSSPPH